MPPPTTTIGVAPPPAPRPAATSTPIPPNAISVGGDKQVTINGIVITIKPDVIDNTIVADGETGCQFDTISTPGTETLTKNKIVKITKVDAISPATCTIQTKYKSVNINPLSKSSYGRGTTVGDIAAGNTSLQFHEGSHGTRCLDFFRNNKPPVFGGKVGMTETAFTKASTDYLAKWTEYINKMDLASLRDVDCINPNALPKNGICSTIGIPKP